MDYDDDDDDIFDNQPEFLAERNIWQRMGGADIGLGLGGVINLRKSGYTLNEKFKLIAAATLKLISDLELGETFTTVDIAHVLNQVESKVPDWQYKNPSAFVVGYMVARNSDYSTLNIDQNSFDTAIEVVAELEGQLYTSIDSYDIIRYTRLCLLNKIR
jgi:hypothetical protein